MSLMRFLVDEDSPQHLCQAVRATEPRIDILFIGEPGAPPKGTLDPDLLAWLENERRALISNDHNTMPGHAADHQAAGNHTYGVFLLRSGFSLQDLRPTSCSSGRHPKPRTGEIS